MYIARWGTFLVPQSWNRLDYQAHSSLSTDVLWQYHSGMSEGFKKEQIMVYEMGEVLGLCCTDACGMVSGWISQNQYQLTNFYKGPWSTMHTDCSTVLNPQKIDALVQWFGCTGRDPSIQAMAILLVKKAYFSKVQLEQWAKRFRDSPTDLWTKQKMTSDVAMPQKWLTLKDKANMLNSRHDHHDTIGEAPKEEES